LPIPPARDLFDTAACAVPREASFPLRDGAAARGVRRPLRR